MLHLPLDIIEKIILSSDMIVTTHNTILTLVKTLVSNYNKLSNDDKLNYKYDYKYQHYVSIYLFLSNNTTKINIYKHSGWYNYLLENKTFMNPHKQLEIINKNIIHNLNLITPLIDFYNGDMSDMNLIYYINYIELNINSKNIKTLIQKILLYWNITIKDIGSFSLLIILLLSGNTFKNRIKSNYMCLENHLYMKFIKEKEDIRHTINMNIYIPCYFISSNNIIPLFQKSIGMGYTYNIAWDILIKKYVSFLFGGSSAEDYYYFDTKLKLYLYKNTTERVDYIKKYKKIININKLIEILLLNDTKSISYYEKICIN